MKRLLTVRETSRELINRASNAVQADFSHAIGSLYTRNKLGKAVHAGTCSFFGYRGERFLVSARHVFEFVNYTDLHVLTKNGVHPLECDAKVTIPTSGNDPFDLFVAKLDQRHEHVVVGLQFVDLELASTKASLFNGGFRMISLVGFPHSRNKPNEFMRNLKGQPHLVSGSEKDVSELTKSTRIQFDERIHVFVKYERKRASDKSGEHKIAVKPQGMSGGLMVDMGIVGTVKEVRDGPSRNPLPLAIITDFVADRQLVAGTRISVLKSFLDKFYS